MNLKDVLKRIMALGDEKLQAYTARGGTGKRPFGVRLGEIRKLAKEIGEDHCLALALWEYHVAGAQNLAVLLMQPEEIFREDLDELVKSISRVPVSNWLVAYVVKQHPDKESLRREWMESENCWAARVGWQLTADRVATSPSGIDLPALLDRIECEMIHERPAVQWTMNSTLVGIGVHAPRLRKRAIAIGEKLGIYRGYRVAKGCTSPYAPIRINFAVKRQGRGRGSA